MSKTVFVNGTVVEPAFLNSLQNLTFSADPGDNLVDGVYERLTDDALSNAPQHLKKQYYDYRDRLKVVSANGLTCAYRGGVIFKLNGEPLSIPPANITVPNSTTTYIFINAQSQVRTDSVLPAICYPMAKVTSSGGSVSIITDLRPVDQIAPRPEAIKIFGGTGDEGDFVATNGQFLDQGIYYFTNFFVPVGIDLNIDKFAKIHVSNTATIAGNIEVTRSVAGGGGLTTALPGYNLTVGGNTGGGFGGASGSGDNAITAYSYAASPLGSGGGSGFVRGAEGTEATIAKGGKGGGGLWIEAAGSISVTGSINARGDNGNGGAIDINGRVDASGAGGGSGGTIILSSLLAINVTPSARIRAEGGFGGFGVKGSSGSGASGGGGGAGGQIVFISPNTNTSGSVISVNGGTQGVNSDGSLVGTLGLGGGIGGSNGGEGGNGGWSSFKSRGGKPGKIIYRAIKPVA